MSESNNHPEKPSKTQRKKDMAALQKLGEALMGLPESQLAKIPLPDDLLESIHLARSLKTHESKRRQLQYIGKIMRGIDPLPIQIALKNIQMTREEHTSQFHQLEQWRDRLISEGDDALQKFLELYPKADRQHLRQLIRKAQHDRANNKKTGGETELFKYLRNLL